MNRIDKVEPIVFYGLLICWLIPVLAFDFFVTGDGPCHFLNSKILLEWFNPESKTYFQPFYFINGSFEPNWLYNLLTMPLLAIFGAVYAEKIFFAGYVLGFCLGFRYLITQINPQAKFLSTIGLLFCYHKLLMMGFLNNSLSLAVWFWVAGWWWKNRDSTKVQTLLVTALLFLLLYSAHPMGLTYGGMMIASMFAGLFVYRWKTDGWRKSIAMQLPIFTGLVVSVLPVVFLFIEFFFRREWSSEKAAVNIKGVLESIGRLHTLTTMQSTERDIAIATSILCGLVFIGAIFWRVKARKWLPTDGLLLFLVLVLYSILQPPSSISGGLEVSLRMGMIPFIVILCWAATASFPVWAKVVAQLGAVGIAIGFLGARLPVHKNASEYAAEVFSCRDYIPARSTVLTLNYDWAGQTTDGKVIANRNWLFNHVDCYLGADRPLVISDNYETHFWYFPTISRGQTDMYQQTDKEGVNFDNRPPRADILSYNRRSGGQNIDYVLLLSYRDEFKEHAYTKEIWSQLEQAYDKVFTSEHGRAIVYKRR